VTNRSSILIFACGNPSRGDDALGPTLLSRIEAAISRGQLPHCDTLTDFQLQVEHALDLNDRELVLFVDASGSAPPPFRLTRLTPIADWGFTTHAITPQAVLAVHPQVSAQPTPACFQLAIRGESFALGSDLSPQAEQYLDAAFELVSEMIRNPALGVWTGLAAADCPPATASHAPCPCAS